MRDVIGVRNVLTGAAAIVFSAAGLAVTPVSAADMSDLPRVMEAAPRVVEEFTTSWYLRGDIGYAMPSVGSVTATVTPPSPTNGSLDDVAVFGVGAGVQSGWLRADVTGDYLLKSNYSGTMFSAGDTRLSVQGAFGLANIYADLGTWRGFTPYIGAGLGASYLTTKSLASPTLVSSQEVPDASKWGLAWALMAGASYRFSDRMFFDAGYRYLDLGGAQTAVDSNGNQLMLDHITAHEFRVGIRYLVE